MKDNYYNKKAVYGDDALLEIIYEIEDKLYFDDEAGEKLIRHEDLKDIFERHIETVREYYKRTNR